MADISKEIQDFQEAVYGEEVRGSLISLAEKVNTESTAAKEAAVNMAGMAAEAVAGANEAVERAGTAAENAEKAMSDLQDAADRGDFTPSIQIGEVVTGEEGSEASVSNSGTGKDIVLDIRIPRGDRGAAFRMKRAWEAEIDYCNDSEYIDIVTYKGSTYGCLASHRSSDMLTPEDSVYWQCLAQKGEAGTLENIDKVKVEFTEAGMRENISKEDTLAVILGKLEKIIADLKDVAFSGAYKDLTGAPKDVGDLTNTAGYVTTDTWKANTAISEGYVASGAGHPNELWGTDAEGNPGWQEGINPEDFKFDTMSGATEEAGGTEGLVPAPGAGMQEAFLQGSGMWRKLGAAAYAGIANNRDTTEEGFLADARQLKELQDQIDLQNSTLEEMGSGNSDGSRFKKVFMNQAEYTDANLLPVYTFAYVFSTATNIPSGATNGSYIITIGVHNGERMQIYLPRAIGIMGVRYIISGSWTVWKNITLT